MMHTLRILPVFLKRALVDDVPSIVQCVIFLRPCERISARNLLRIEAYVVPERRACAQSVWIESQTGSRASRLRAPISEMQRDGFRSMSRLDEDRRAQRKFAVSQPQ